MGGATLEVKATATGAAFFYGTLRHGPVLQALLGHVPPLRPAVLADHVVLRASEEALPILCPAPGATVEGLLAEGLRAEDEARLEFYAEAFFGVRVAMPVQAEGRTVTALVEVPGPRWKVAGWPWRLPEWQGDWGAIGVALTEDIMALYGQVPAAAIAARLAEMRVRAASRVRAAAEPAPATLRRDTDRAAVSVVARSQPYARFFAVEEYDLTYPRFDGGQSAQVNRAAFISGDAVTVLPYDPARDRVLLVEQFRAGPFARGDARPWLLEAVAGRIDPGETPEAAARREAEEEAGLTLGDLLPVGSYYPSPGAKSEYLYSFVALTDLPDGAAGVFGVEDEAEDIRGHLIGFETLMALVESGEVNNAPLILTALWLQRERPRLRGVPGRDV